MHRSGESPITYDDEWFVGEDKTLQWTIYDGDPLTETSPPTVKNLTGYSLQFKMAATEGGTSLLTKAVTSASPTTGICTGAFGSADYGSAPAGTYYYTMSRTDSGQNRVLAWGTAVLRARVT